MVLEITPKLSLFWVVSAEAAQLALGAARAPGSRVIFLRAKNFPRVEFLEHEL